MIILESGTWRRVKDRVLPTEGDKRLARRLLRIRELELKPVMQEKETDELSDLLKLGDDE